jgi:hypothetical protein
MTPTFTLLPPPDAFVAALRSVRDLLAARLWGDVPARVTADVIATADEIIAMAASAVAVDDGALMRDAEARARAIGLCPDCGTACVHGANENCASHLGCGALNGLAPAGAEAVRARIRASRAFEARRKLGALEVRCEANCPGWVVIAVDREPVFEVERCDACWKDVAEADRLDDKEAEALAEAQAELARVWLREGAAIPWPIEDTTT